MQNDSLKSFINTMMSSSQFPTSMQHHSYFTLSTEFTSNTTTTSLASLNGTKEHAFICMNQRLQHLASIWPSCLTLSEAFMNVALTLVVMLVIVLGNLMVVLTVKFDSKLRAQRQNWLIVSLAVADLLVGSLVMPLTLLYETIGVWVLGSVLCELWLALDVLFVTASILHICIISLDRYWSVTQPLTYPVKRTPKRICVMIGVAWMVSFLICFPPLLGWRPLRHPGECSVSSELDYVLYSSLGSFYIPVAILVVVYWRIYEITKSHSQQRLKDTQRMDETLCQMTAKGDSNATTAAMLLRERETAIGNSRGNGLENKRSYTMDRSLQNEPKYNREHATLEYCNSFDSSSIATTTLMAPTYSGTIAADERIGQQQAKSPAKGTLLLRSMFSPLLQHGDKKSCCTVDGESIKLKRIRSLERRKRRLKAKERQATLLLGLILFAFIASWMPFFIIYVLNALDFRTEESIFKFFFWLGYCNSAINPIIYTYYNREFKRGLFRLVRHQQHHLLFLKHLIN